MQCLFKAQRTSIGLKAESVTLLLANGITGGTARRNKHL